MKSDSADFYSSSVPEIDPALERIATRWLQPACQLARIPYFLAVPLQFRSQCATGQALTCRRRNSEAAIQLCGDTHRSLRRTAAAGKPSETVCRNGLWACAVPIMGDLKPLAFIEVGGVLISSPECSGDRRPRTEPNGSTATRFMAGEVRLILELLQNAALAISQEAKDAAIIPVCHLPPAVAYAQSEIQKRFSERLSLAAMAREVGFSEDHFSKMFKRATGMAFTESVMCTRIAHARKLLASRAVRVSEIAFECGFESVPYFNRMFKRLTGKSPTAFRATSRTADGVDA